MPERPFGIVRIGDQDRHRTGRFGLGGARSAAGQSDEGCEHGQEANGAAHGDLQTGGSSAGTSVGALSGQSALAYDAADMRNGRRAGRQEGMRL